jgi:secondary thiamine-phosphate synthase enzyme
VATAASGTGAAVGRAAGGPPAAGAAGFSDGRLAFARERLTGAQCTGRRGPQQARPARLAKAWAVRHYPTRHPRERTAMKSATEHLTMNTRKHRELVPLTDEVASFVEKSGIQEGMVLVSAMHITAGVFVNDDEPGLHADIWDWLEHLAPEADYRHHRTGETNGDAHLKNLLVHHQVILPITKGRLDLGPWQRVFYAEFDGRRPKRLIFKAIGE